MTDPVDILDGRIRIFAGDCLAVLASMEPDSVDCVVTSPPYWGLRDYGVDGQIGLEASLGEHLDVMVAVFEAVKRVLKPTGTLWLNYGDCYATSPNGRSAADIKAAGADNRGFVDKPFSTVGPIYVPAYEKSERVAESVNKGQLAAAHGGRVVARRRLKPKDLCMIPNRLAIALQDAGWWVRSEIVWGKNNPMPDSSGAYRPSAAHEKIFMLTKSDDGDVWRARDTGEISFQPDLSETCPLVTKPDQTGPRWTRIGAYYDAEAVKQGLSGNTHDRGTKRSPPSDSAGVGHRDWTRSMTRDAEIQGWKMPDGWDTGAGGHGSFHRKGREKGRKYEGGQNGSGTSPPHKGLQQARDQWREGRKRGSTPRHQGHIENEFLDTGPGGHGSFHRKGREKGKPADKQRGHSRRHAGFNERWDKMSKQEQSAGGRYLRNYEPAPLDVWPIATKPFSEAHFATFPPDLAERCILAGCPPGGLVLDPFGGAGTTGLVAARLGRRAHLIELNAEYIDIARRRIEREWKVQRPDERPPEGPLFDFARQA